MENQEDAQEYEEADVDLVVLLPESPRTVQGMVSFGHSVLPEVQESLSGGIPPVGVVLVEPAERGVELTVRESEVTPSPLHEEVAAPRRMGRVGAGQHSNVHHLPRAVGEVRNRATSNPEILSNTITVLFRPWSW
ncbi:uncharacterized protein LOC108190122, partial [Tachysurus ichikawai]